MRLAHLRLPHTVPYTHASNLQDHLVQRLLAYKRAPEHSATTPPPDPTIITAQFHPVYTCGRREIGTVSASQIAHLRASGRAEFVEALRGGQTTFHGPGQLVAYPIVDLKRHGVSPRCYVRLLEESTIGTCGRFGIRGFTTENPGVWTSAERKIAAVGVHLRRNVTSHGVGVNVRTDLWWFERIVACGLEGKEATSFEREGVSGVGVEEVGEVFVEEMARRLGMEEVYEIEPERAIATLKEDLICIDYVHRALYADHHLFPITDDEGGSKLAKTETASTVKMRGMEPGEYGTANKNTISKRHG